MGTADQSAAIEAGVYGRPPGSILVCCQSVLTPFSVVRQTDRHL